MVQDAFGDLVTNKDACWCTENGPNPPDTRSEVQGY
jgi:hypothetical protein